MKLSDASNPLSTEHLMGDLKMHVARGAAATTIAQGVKFFVQIASITILARLLTPDDFGLVAMVTVVTGLLAKFKDGGLSMATIQKGSITHDQVTNLFWINVGLGLALTIVTILSAPLLSWIYGEPRLALICMATAASFLVGGLSVQHEAILKRQMRFDLIAQIDVASMISGVAVAITFAWLGYGYWALVLMPLTTTLVQVILLWVCSNWRPGMLRSKTNMDGLLKFGLNLTGANVVGHFASNMTPFAIGIIGGAQPLGLYNRAYALSSIPGGQILSPVMNVAQPALARVAEDNQKFRAVTVKLIRKISLIAIFITATMVMLADWLIAVFLGDAWSQAVPYFQALALLGVLEPATCVAALALIAAGRADLMLRWKVLHTLIIFLTLLVGLNWGVMGVVYAYVIGGFIERILFILYVSKHTSISKSDFVTAMLPTLLIFLVLVALLALLRASFNANDPYFGLAVTMLFSFLVYCLLCVVIKPVREEFLDVLKMGWLAIKKQKNIGKS